MKIIVVDHPLILEQLTLLRNRKTNQVAFRKAIHRIGRMMAYEFARTLKLERVTVTTPLKRASGYGIKDKEKIVIVMVLRAAIPLVEGIYKVFPTARTGVISAWRGRAPGFRVSVNYTKIPEIREDDTVIIADPMLATGHTLLKIAKVVARLAKPRRLAFFSVISTKAGIDLVSKRFPEAEFYTCAIDPKLDSHGYIVPGLGDAGDRSFGSPARRKG